MEENDLSELLEPLMLKGVEDLEGDKALSVHILIGRKDGFQQRSDQRTP